MKVIQGQVQFTNGSPAANATLKLQLSQDSTTGGQQISPVVFYITLDTNGNTPSGTEIWANDELQPNTFYIATLTMPSLGRIYGPENIVISGISPINLNLFQPAQQPLPSNLDITIEANTAFSALTTSTNTQATMTVGSGASLEASGSGVINATEINGIPITGTLTHAGQIPISQPGNETAVWADPLVQGLYGTGTAVSGINPVLVGAQNPSGDLANLNLDADGNLFVNLSNSSIAVTGTFWPATQPVSGTVAVSNFPATQAVSGTISVSNFPSTQAVTQSGSWTVGVTGSVAVTGTFWQATQPVSGTVSVSSVSGSVAVTNSGTFAVQDSASAGYLATLAGTVSSSKVSVAQATAANLNATVVGTGTFAVQATSVPSATATAVSTNIQQALTSSAQIKSSAGTVYGFDWGNPNATAAYVFIYNTTSAPTIGSTTNLVYQKLLPGGAAGVGSHFQFEYPLACSSGIYIAVSASPNSSSAPSTGLVLTTLYL